MTVSYAAESVDKTAILKDIVAALPLIDLKKKKPGVGLSFGPVSNSANLALAFLKRCQD